MKRRNLSSQNLEKSSEKTEQKLDVSSSKLPSFNLEENTLNMTKLNSSKKITNLVVSSGGTNGFVLI
jgi:hypothetical protein